MTLLMLLQLNLNVKLVSNMRPIEKKQPGEVVQYTDSRGNVIEHVVLEDYDEYGEAKLPLVGNLGRYCSYCEGLREVDALEIDVSLHRYEHATPCGSSLPQHKNRQLR